MQSWRKYRPEQPKLSAAPQESELSGSPGRQRRRQRSHAPATTTTTTTAISTTTTLNQIGRRCSSFRLLVRFGLLGSLTTTAAAAGTTTTNNNNNNNNNNTNNINNNNTLSLVDGLPSCCAESAVAAHEGEEDSSWALVKCANQTAPAWPAQSELGLLTTSPVRPPGSPLIVVMQLATQNLWGSFCRYTAAVNAAWAQRLGHRYVLSSGDYLKRQDLWRGGGECSGRARGHEPAAAGGRVGLPPGL
ncbi:unnamed protein product [Polarella glacialis]|uniref:Uncharacterized protein n=1 Tax=Polarella glacialis TaxID=89957 RepID=A0A813J591_POLGL|nr:unnamed protein product [Polarella glacialis]